MFLFVYLTSFFHQTDAFLYITDMTLVNYVF